MYGFGLQCERVGTDSDRYSAILIHEIIERKLCSQEVQKKTKEKLYCNRKKRNYILRIFQPFSMYSNGGYCKIEKKNYAVNNSIIARLEKLSKKKRVGMESSQR